MNISDWAIEIAVVLVVVIGIIAAFGGVGYFIGGRFARRPFLGYIIRYAVVFLGLLGFESLILWLAPSVHSTLQHLTAVVVGWALDLANVRNSVSGSAIGVQAPSILFKIDVACLGGLLFWAYIALVVAETRATRRQRLIGLGTGLAGLLVFNLFRIFISIYIESKTGVNVHNYFYLVNMVVVLLLWAGWVWTLKPKSVRVIQTRSQQG